jgi:hypothetical protein
MLLLLLFIIFYISYSYFAITEDYKNNRNKKQPLHENKKNMLYDELDDINGDKYKSKLIKKSIDSENIFYSSDYRKRKFVIY